MNSHGQYTVAAAEAITDEMDKRGFDVYYDHGKKSDRVGTIAVSFEKKLHNDSQISQLDIAIVDRQANNYRIIALIEIEDTTDNPKTLIGDVFTTLMGDSVHLPDRSKTANVGAWTTLIILGKSGRHPDRLKEISKKVNRTKLDFGTENSKIGNIVIDFFPSADELKKILLDHINNAIRMSLLEK